MNRNSDFIPFALPDIGKREEDAVLRVLRSGWLTTGNETKSFEEEFARRVGATHALAVNSATAGLHLALEALGAGPGDRVLTTPYTFTATAEVARYLGADPLFVDIEKDSFNIDPVLVEEALAAAEGAAPGKGRIAAVVPVHVGGHLCAMERILASARRYGVPVVEDAAHAFPSKTAAGYAGCLGDVGVYSFYATKTITTGEGGMVAVRDPEIARRISIMRLHGIDREIWNRYTSKKPSWQYAVVEAGYKYNLTDLASALGRVQLGRADKFLDKRRALAKHYDEAFGTRDYLILPPDGEGNARHLYPLRLELSKLTLSRDEYIEKLSGLGIGTSVHYIPLHLHPYWQGRYGFTPESFPEANKKFTQEISLPIYTTLTASDVERIIQAVVSVGDSHYRKA